MALVITPSQPPHSIIDHNSNNNGGPSFSRENRLLRLFNECKEMSQLKQIHAQTLRSNNTPQTLFLFSRILHFSSMADIDYAFQVFDQIPTPNSFMWNTLIRACARSDDELKERAMVLFRTMLERGSVSPDKYTFPFVLRACAYLFAFSEGTQAHSHVLKLGFGSDVYVNNSLIHFYASCGRLDLARKVFDEMPERSIVSWNAVIDGLVQSGEFEDSLSLFRSMPSEFEPDKLTMQSVVNACAGLGALSLGMWAHSYVLKRPLADDVLMDSCLIEMYSKCGSVNFARQVFDKMPKRDVTAWNSIILGLAMHGKADVALEYFHRLVSTESFKPNSITFVGVLSACKHRGLVNEGREYFDSMINDYRIEPKLEHYGCLVDLLARSGHLDEAIDLVTKMPLKPDAVIWRSLLDACAREGASVELSEEIAKQSLDSEGGGVRSSGVYVILSRVYASARRWNDVGFVRRLMTDEGIQKEPGVSSIEVDGVISEFFAGDTCHPRSREIYRALDVVNDRIVRMGYSPDLSQAILVEGDETKKISLGLHSERIAVAYGLLNSTPGVPIRIFKNLRVCDNCHEVFKLISEAFGVEIVMRDRVRFHCFENGSCSCNDYW